MLHAEREMQNAGETDEWADENAANANGTGLMSLEMLSVKSSKIVASCRYEYTWERGYAQWALYNPCLEV